MNFKTTKMVKLKTWKELKKEFGRFINRNYHNSEEIHLSESDYYINIEERSICGQKVVLTKTTVRGVYFTSYDGGHYIYPGMIKRDCNTTQDPEMFL